MKFVQRRSERGRRGFGGWWLVALAASGLASGLACVPRGAEGTTAAAGRDGERTVSAGAASAAAASAGTLAEVTAAVSEANMLRLREVARLE